ncbi:MAG TPA: pilus assembly protein TadG-related protein [Anaeromyxobacteraceae bacterium]|nr:pilus assembly protein TadG-related protein [Anaeromyxobacteraceae bacterium]
MRCARRHERGAILIWAVLGLVMVGSMLALALNVGRMISVRGALQNGTDSAALAAAAELNGEQSGVTAGEGAAVAYAGAHVSDAGLNVTIDPGADVVFGTWDRAARVFTPVTGRTAVDLRAITAVQVRAGRETARSNAVPITFGGAFVTPTSVDVRATSIAVGGGPCQERCAFPAVFADCIMVNPDGSLDCSERYYVLNSDWQDNLGLTSLDPNEPASVPNIKDALHDCVPTSADMEIPVTNGNMLQPISVDPYFNDLPKEVSSPVVHVERCEPAHFEPCDQSIVNGPCMNAKFVGDLPIVGYATFVLCYVTGANVGTWPPANWPVAECGAAPTLADFPGVDPNQWPDPFLKHTFFLQHRCNVEEAGPGTGVAGCGFFGTSSTRSRLVQ